MVATTQTVPVAADRLPRSAYERAERFLAWNVEKLYARAYVEPAWLDGGDRGWYRVATGDGFEFVLFDTATGNRRPAFDHVRLAAALSVATGKPHTHNALPFETVTFLDGGARIAFDAAGDRWIADLATYAVTRAEVEPPPAEFRSPDGKRAAFVRDHNLWVRDLATGRERALTAGGEARNDWGAAVKSILLDAGLTKATDTLKPAVIWSPDSKRVLTHRLDRRGVKEYHLIQYAPPADAGPRPRHFAYTYPLPGDETIPLAHLAVCDADGEGQGQARPLAVDPLPHASYEGTPFRGRVLRKTQPPPRWQWWSADGSKVYVLRSSRDYLRITLWEADAATGAAKILVDEEASTPVGASLSTVGIPNVHVLNGGTSVLWFSQRDGNGHLYVYDVEAGGAPRQLTAGAWNVADVYHVDEAVGLVYFTAIGREAGMDPYFQVLYRVPLAGGEPERLTPEDAEHVVTFAPNGKGFVDTYSRADLAPATVLRAPDGTLVQELERADIEPLLATGWRHAERFTVKARDGVTDIYGIILRPSWFDPENPVKLPVIDYIYAGPQKAVVPKAFADVAGGPGGRSAYWQLQALAELGFAGVMIDGMGFPGRNRAFHEVTYRKLEDASVADHVAAIRQLGAKYDYLDVERGVGIYGHSGGGYGSTRAMLEFPDFFKVAVSSSGNHDQRVYHERWVIRYQGIPVGPAQANQTDVSRLKGKLLLVHGDMDENVHIVSTMVMVDELIKANKDFDFFVMPNRSHVLTDDPYFVRRRWDYFVEHLLGVQPPHEYRLEPSPPGWRPD